METPQYVYLSIWHPSIFAVGPRQAETGRESALSAVTAPPAELRGKKKRKKRSGDTKGYLGRHNKMKRNEETRERKDLPFAGSHSHKNDGTWYNGSVG